MNTTRSTYYAIKNKYSVIKNNISYPAFIKFNKIINSIDLNNFKKNNYIHIFCLQPHHSRILIKRILLKNSKKTNYFIGYWPWELSKWPDIWRNDLKLVDEVWCLSKFIYDSITNLNFSIKKFIINPGFRVKREIKNNFLEKNYKFLFSYDPRSKFQRKNPKGVLIAFWNAFGLALEWRLAWLLDFGMALAWFWNGFWLVFWILD